MLTSIAFYISARSIYSFELTEAAYELDDELSDSAFDEIELSDLKYGNFDSLHKAC